MFYAHFVLAKKGPLARIWLAAHWDKKLTKAHVFETSIEKSVEGILHPKVKMALRTSGHLLLGVVRIYSRKAKYLLADCNEAFVKIKMAFRPGMVDLPEENREAAVNAITLPEVFHDFDAIIPDINDVDIQAQLSMNQSRAEEITMREDYGSLSLPHHDEGFGDLEFNDEGPDLMRDAPSNSAMLPPLSFSQTFNRVKENSASIVGGDDGFGAPLGHDMMGDNLFGDGGLFDDTPMETSSLSLEPTPGPSGLHPTLPPLSTSGGVDGTINLGGGGESDDDYGGPPSIGSCPTPGSPLGFDGAPPQLPHSTGAGDGEEVDGKKGVEEDEEGEEGRGDQVTLLQNEEESFALGPIETPIVKGQRAARRKRKLIVDEVKNISGEEMKSQLSDTSDIVTTLDLAPPTKRLMHWKETGGVEKLFALPGRHIPSRTIARNYQSHLNSRPAETEEFVLNNENLEPFESGPPPLGPPQTPLHTLPPPSPSPKASKGGAKGPGRPRGSKRKALEPLEEYSTSTREYRVGEEEEEEYAKNNELPPVLSAEGGPVRRASTPRDSFTIAESTLGVIGGGGLDDISRGGVVVDDNNKRGLDDNSRRGGGEVSNNSTAFSIETPNASLLTHSSLAPIDQTTLNMTLMENMGYDGGEGTMTTQHHQSTLISHEENISAAVGSVLPNTPWGGNEDYDFPASVGPAEEQATDETYEQYEERVLNKRAAQMYHIIKSKLEIEPTVYFSTMCNSRNSRKQVAQKFYTLLVLKKAQAVELVQPGAYEDIGVIKGNKFLCASL